MIVARIAAALLIGTGAIQVRGNPVAPPNILLIVGEDHGAELSCYGDPVIQTPHIDGLAAGGLLFEHAYVTQSVCSPSRSSIFTGLYPHQNGQLGLATHHYAMFREWPTTYSLLKEAGYRTGLIGKTHVNPPEVIERHVDFRFQQGANFGKRNVAQYAIEAGTFFRSSPQPFFMTVNYPDSHWPLQARVDGLPSRTVDPDDVKLMPYIGGPSERVRKHVEGYYNCMLRLDECVGGLLAELKASGKMDNTLVVFIGDHGAQFARGKTTVYEGGMKIPFIARWPGIIEAGRRSQALVSIIDLLPTFLAAAGHPEAIPNNAPGRSLHAVLAGTNTDDVRTYLACERNCDAAAYSYPQRTIRDDRFKLIYTMLADRDDPGALKNHQNAKPHWSGTLNAEELIQAPKVVQNGYDVWLHPPRVQLYDLENDPWEWHNLADDSAYDDVEIRLLAALQEWQQDTHDPLVDPEKLRLLTEENDAVAKQGTRQPKGGWKYLDYLAPTMQ